MNFVDLLLKAMRCRIEPDPEAAPDCSNCPYELLSKLPNGFPADRAVLIDGKLYFRSCDSDQIMKEAIALIEGWSKLHE